jgi:triacylglycerol lipase
MLNPKNPVVLIHGLHDTLAVFDQMDRYLSNLGWKIHRLNLIPNNGVTELNELALQVNNYINRTFSPEQTIDLIGFSMGGLITRYYLQRLGGLNKVQRYINISAPNQGTLMAYTLNYAGICQMRPQSSFLRDLNQDVTVLNQINLTVMWTPFDLMILPAHSSQLGIGKELKIPVLYHPWMLNDQRVLSLIKTELEQKIKTRLVNNVLWQF